MTYYVIYSVDQGQLCFLTPSPSHKHFSFLDTAYCNGLCGLFLVAWFGIFAGGTCLPVVNMIAMCVTIVAVVVDLCGWWSLATCTCIGQVFC